MVRSQNTMSKMNNQIKNLGRTATDKITGFSGIATGFVVYITGCNQYLINPKAKKGGD